MHIEAYTELLRENFFSTFERVGLQSSQVAERNRISNSQLFPLAKQVAKHFAEHTVKK